MAALRADEARAEAARAIQDGVALQRRGQPAEAADAFRRAIAAWPDGPDGHFLLGRLLLALGRAGDARAALEQANRLAPKNPLFWAGRGEAEAALGATGSAVACYGQAAALAPADPRLQAGIGCALQNLGRAAEAEACFRRVLAATPADAEIWNNLGRALQDLDRLEEAAQAFRKAVDLDPKAPLAVDNLGNALKELDRGDEAAGCFRRAIALKPDFALAHFHLGNVLGLAGQADESLASLDRALALDPTLAEAANIRGQALMARGDFARGLDGYEARRRTGGRSGEARGYTGVEWDGRPLGRAPLRLWAEQGLGDHLLYAGLLPLAAERAPALSFECDARLVGLLRRGLPGVAIVADGDDSGLPTSATHLPLASLMRALKPWPQGFGPKRRYIAPDPERARKARDWLAALPGKGPRIGLSWRSSAKRIGRQKSLPLPDWGAVLQRDAVFVNLQYGDTADEIAATRARLGVEVHSQPDLDRFADIEGLAALIDGLDLVVTTSSVTAHLAGALGKAGHLMLQRVPLWYWSPRLRPGGLLFYPSLTPHYQTTEGDWRAPLEALAAALGRP
jgi:tetratricopeptide (TPR) repeat protein